MAEEIVLRVGELTAKEESYKGIVRIDSNNLVKIGVREGDIVEIEGKRKTAAIALRAYPADIGLNIIRMDGITRRNAKVSVGESVKVRKAEYKIAKRVVLAPAEDKIFTSSISYLKQSLLKRPVVKGDLIVPSPVFRRRDDFLSAIFGEDIEDFFTFSPFPQITFYVVNTEPAGIVVIDEETAIEVLKERPKHLEIEEKGIPKITWEDIGDLEEVKQKLREIVELPLRHPEIFERLGIEPPKGVLLYGPPGTGKTLLAKAVANESGAYFISINGPEIMSKWFGESEKRLREIFEEAEKNAPSIIFIDEIDALAPKREEVVGEVEKRIVAQLLALMDGLKSRGKVIVIGATNRPNALDPALRRPGRFDREIEVPPPDAKGRLEILKIHTRNMPLEVDLTPDIVSKYLRKKIDEELSKLKLEREDLDKKIKELEDKLEAKDIFSQIKNRIMFVEDKLNKLKKLKEAISVERELDELTRFVVENERLLLIRDSYDPRSVFYKNNIEKAKSEAIRLALSTGLISPENIIEMKRSKEFVDRMLEKIAEITHGYVGADLAALCKEAAMHALRRVLPEIQNYKEGEIPKEVLEKLVVKKEDFEHALRVVQPSAMREVFVEVPKVKWEDIGGLEEVKQKLREIVEWPLKYPKYFERLGIEPPKGVLLYGPPGTGKTLLAKAVANESGANFIAIKGPEIFSKWVGESEKAIREIFRKAREVAPSIIFIDEIDAIAPMRGLEIGTRVTENVVAQLLTEMSGIRDLKNVVVIAATNRPDILDPALLRPGRFDRLVYVPPPDLKARLEILKIHTRNMPLDKDVDLQKIAERTEGYSGADLEAVCKEASILALREAIANNIPPEKLVVKAKHFEAALEIVKPSVTKEMVEFYKKFEERLKKRVMETERKPERYIG